MFKINLTGRLHLNIPTETFQQKLTKLLEKECVCEITEKFVPLQMSLYVRLT